MTDWLSAPPPEFDVRGRSIALIGMAATGLAAARALVRRGARVAAHDAKPANALGDTLTRLRELGVACHVGDQAYTGIDTAELIVPSPGVPMDAPVLQEAVRRGQPVLAEIEIAWQIARAPIVGVTGTNGKTTTVFLIAAMLKAAGIEAQVCGNTLAGGFPRCRSSRRRTRRLGTKCWSLRSAASSSSGFGGSGPAWRSSPISLSIT
jgi:UDP-N-acetylmuramoylalanine-D-glutamate ligase